MKISIHITQVIRLRVLSPTINNKKFRIMDWETISKNLSNLKKSLSNPQKDEKKALKIVKLYSIELNFPQIIIFH